MQLNKLINNSRELLKSKQPFNKQNHVGIEIECIIKGSKFELQLWLTAMGVHKYVELKDDCSIGDYDDDTEDTCELAIIAPEKQIFNVLQKVCKALTKVKAKVNKTCGVHVHIDIRNRDPKLVFKNFVLSQNLLYAINPDSRMENTYCSSTRSDDLEYAERNYDRRGINPHAVSKHKTIEVRIHSGSTNYKKLSNWIRILLKIAKRKSVLNVVSNKEIKDVDFFFKRLKIQGKLKTYVHERLREFERTNDSLPDMYLIEETNNRGVSNV